MQHSRLLRMFLSVVFVHFLLCRLISSSYDISDDNTYKFKWGGNNEATEDRHFSQNILISTNFGEKFECVVPLVQEFPETQKLDQNSTASEEALLSRLFEAHPCSTRTEFYWSYELCHKNYVRQFHEELLPDKSSKTQEYFLGYYHKDTDSSSPRNATHPGILLGGSSYPYFAMNFVDGTPCDLTGESRSTSVLYICLEDEEGRIIQVSETESCHYQVVFATRYLCSNPSYRLPKRPAKQLSCSPREGSIVKPKGLLEFEKQQEQLSQHGISNLAALFGNIGFKNIRVEANRRNNMIVYRIRTVDPNEDSETSEAITSQEDDSSSTTTDESATRGDAGDTETQPTSTTKPTAPDEAYHARFLEFITGKLCLQGRTQGWWQYEICMRSNVTQYHINNRGKRTQVILLGRWDYDVHKKWQAQRLGANVGSSTEAVDLFYGDGQFCQSIEKPREVVVKLRCNKAANGIHLSFSERSECRYTALVESSAFCELTLDEIKSAVY